MATNLQDEVWIPLYLKMIDKINAVKPYLSKRSKRNSIWAKAREAKQIELNKLKQKGIIP